MNNFYQVSIILSLIFVIDFVVLLVMVPQRLFGVELPRLARQRFLRTAVSMKDILRIFVNVCPVAPRHRNR